MGSIVGVDTASEDATGLIASTADEPGVIVADGAGTGEEATGAVVTISRSLGMGFPAALSEL